MIVIFQCHLFAAILKSQNDLNEKLRRKREQRRRKLEMEQAAEKEDFERKVNKMIFFLFALWPFSFAVSLPCLLRSLSVVSSPCHATSLQVVMSRIKDVCCDV